MKAIKFAVIAALFCSAASLSAQTDNHSRVYASYIRGNANIELGRHSEDFDQNGFNVGYAYGLNISGTLPLFLEYGAELNYLTMDESSDFLKNDAKFLNVAIPVNVVYQFSVMDDFMHIAPYAGVNFRLNLMGKNKVKGYQGSGSEEIDFFDEDDMGDNTAKRFQLGMNAGVNFYVGHLMLGYRYQYDFMPYADGKDEDALLNVNYDMKISAHYLSIGYRF